MDEITDQNQPVSHPLSLTCASCIRAGQRAAAGKATHANAGLVTRRVSASASSRALQGPGAAGRSRHCSSARPGACSPRTSQGFPRPGRGRADGRNSGVDR
jgi:hypothetical protein